MLLAEMCKQSNCKPTGYLPSGLGNKLQSLTSNVSSSVQPYKALPAMAPTIKELRLFAPHNSPAGTPRFPSPANKKSYTGFIHRRPPPQRWPKAFFKFAVKLEDTLNDNRREGKPSPFKYKERLARQFERTTLAPGMTRGWTRGVEALG